MNVFLQTYYRYVSGTVGIDPWTMTIRDAKVDIFHTYNSLGPEMRIPDYACANPEYRDEPIRSSFGRNAIKLAAGTWNT